MQEPSSSPSPPTPHAANGPVPSAAWLPPGTFEGATAVVTGGGTGLGLQLSRGLASLGARVVIASRSAEHHAPFLDECAARGWHGEAEVLDVREDAAVRVFAERVLERHGRVDLLVNNAAGNFVCPTERLSANAWRAVLGIVLDGTFFCSKHFGRAMLRAGGGALLNVVATYAWTGMPGVAHSASAKAGVLALSKTLAAEWADRGVRVNAIAPGPFHSDGAQRNLWPDEETEARMRAQIPIGRFADVHEVAAHGLYLLSPIAAAITGECLVIDGGMTLGAGRMWSAGDLRGARTKAARQREQSEPGEHGQQSERRADAGPSATDARTDSSGDSRAETEGA